MLTISILPNKILKPVQSAVRQEFTHIRSNSLSYLNVGIFVRVHNANEGHITAELVADLIFLDIVLANVQHVLRDILPDDRNNHSYSLSPRRHERMLAIRRDSRYFSESQIYYFKDLYCLLADGCILSTVCLKISNRTRNIIEKVNLIGDNMK